MTLTEIEQDDVVKDNIVICRPIDPIYKTIYDYAPELYGEHRKRMSFLRANHVLDYTKKHGYRMGSIFRKRNKNR